MNKPLRISSGGAWTVFTTFKKWKSNLSFETSLSFLSAFLRPWTGWYHMDSKYTYIHIYIRYSVRYINMCYQCVIWSSFKFLRRGLNCKKPSLQRGEFLGARDSPRFLQFFEFFKGPFGDLFCITKIDDFAANLPGFAMLPRVTGKLTGLDVQHISCTGTCNYHWFIFI